MFYDKCICSCDTDSLKKRRELLSLKMFHEILRTKDHILRDLLPTPLPSCNRLRSFHCRTEKRQSVRYYTTNRKSRRSAISLSLPLSLSLSLSLSLPLYFSLSPSISFLRRSLHLFPSSSFPLFSPLQLSSLLIC